MSFVECMECNGRFKGITPNHVKRHGLTVEQYRQRHPTAKMVSDLWIERHAEKARNRVFHRKCRKCGITFRTGCTCAYYCPKCQRVRRVYRKRQVGLLSARRRINSGRLYESGTFTCKWYLEIVDGRVRGAVLLENHKAINSYGRAFKGSAPIEYEATCLITIYLIVWNGKLYCGECGSQLTVARENEHYTIPAEICCRSCGIVYDLDDIAELRERR